LPELAPGPHTLTIKAWDVLNNSSEHDLTFTVVPSAELQIDRVLNYPNPFTTRTSFWFEHNQPGADLTVTVEIYTVSGKRIKRITQAINTPGNRSSEIAWDGRDEWGAKIGRGVYLYRLQVRTAGGQKKEKWERLVFLN
jgi:flagellar hook assembly protein FlgD